MNAPRLMEALSIKLMACTVVYCGFTTIIARGSLLVVPPSHAAPYCSEVDFGAPGPFYLRALKPRFTSGLRRVNRTSFAPTNIVTIPSGIRFGLGLRRAVVNTLKVSRGLPGPVARLALALPLDRSTTQRDMPSLKVTLSG
jgi:hypothetical protein